MLVGEAPGAPPTLAKPFSEATRRVRPSDPSANSSKLLDPHHRASEPISPRLLRLPRRPESISPGHPVHIVLKFALLTYVESDGRAMLLYLSSEPHPFVASLLRNRGLFTPEIPHKINSVLAGSAPRLEGSTHGKHAPKHANLPHGLLYFPPRSQWSRTIVIAQLNGPARSRVV